MENIDSATPPPSFYIFNNSSNQSKFGGFMSLISYILGILTIIFLIYDYFVQTPIISFIEQWEPNEEKTKLLKVAFRYTGNVDAYESFETKAIKKIVKNDSLTTEEYNIDLYNCDQNFTENINGEWKCIKGGFELKRKDNDYNYLYFPLILKEKNKTDIFDKTVKLELIYERQVIHHFDYLTPFETFLDKKDYTFQNEVKTIYYEYLKFIKYETSGTGTGISLFDYFNFKYFNLTKLGSKSQLIYSTYIDRNEGTIRILSQNKNESGALALHFSNNSFYYHRKYQPFIEYISLFGGFYSVFIAISKIFIDFYSKTNDNFRMMNYFINKNNKNKEKTGSLSLIPDDGNKEESKTKIIDENKKKEESDEKFLSFDTDDEQKEEEEKKLKMTNAIDSFKNITFWTIIGNGIKCFSCLKNKKNQRILNYINDFFQENFSLEKIYFNQLKLIELFESSHIQKQSLIINKIENNLNSMF